MRHPSTLITMPIPANYYYYYYYTASYQWRNSWFIRKEKYHGHIYINPDGLPPHTCTKVKCILFLRTCHGMNPKYNDIGVRLSLIYNTNSHFFSNYYRNTSSQTKYTYNSQLSRHPCHSICMYIWNKATRSPEISREQVQKLTPQFLLYIYIGYRFPLSLIYYLGKPPSS